MAKYAADRVRNVSACGWARRWAARECHDHKFDPFTTTDFYSFAAFFADIKEVAVGVQEQADALPEPSKPQSLAAIDGEIAALRRRSTRRRPSWTRPRHVGSKRWPAKPAGRGSRSSRPAASAAAARR